MARWLFLAFLLAFTVLPMVWMLSTSLKTEFAAMQQPPDWIPTEPTLEQYTTLLSPANRTGQQFLRYLSNSIWVSTATTVLGVLVAVPAAYAFSRFSFPGREPLFFSVLVRNMFPVVVFLIPLFILMRKLQLVDTHLSLILTYLTFGLPLSIWLLKGFYDNIPPELERAARIDGATRFQAFWKIVMPLSSPGTHRDRDLRLHPGLERIRLRAHLSQLTESADAAGRSAEVLHRICHQLAGADGGLVHHERAGGRALPGAAAVLRARPHRRRGQASRDEGPRRWRV